MKKTVLVIITMILCIPIIAFSADSPTISSGLLGTVQQSISGLQTQEANLQNQINNLQNQINNIQLTPGPQGPAGPAGPQGATGTINGNITKAVYGYFKLGGAPDGNSLSEQSSNIQVMPCGCFTTSGDAAMCAWHVMLPRDTFGIEKPACFVSTSQSDLTMAIMPATSCTDAPSWIPSSNYQLVITGETIHRTDKEWMNYIDIKFLCVL